MASMSQNRGPGEPWMLRHTVNDRSEISCIGSEDVFNIRGTRATSRILSVAVDLVALDCDSKYRPAKTVAREDIQSIWTTSVQNIMVSSASFQSSHFRRACLYVMQISTITNYWLIKTYIEIRSSPTHAFTDS